MNKKPLSQFDKGLLKVRKTKGHLKMITYLKDLVLRPDFRKDLRKFRTKFGIPLEGFSTEVTLTNHNIWEDYEKKKEGYYPSLNKILEKYGIDIYWGGSIADYILTNELSENITYSTINTVDLRSSFKENTKKRDENFLNWIKDYSKDFPIALFLNPYSSRNEIIDFVEKTFSLIIKPKLDRYKGNSNIKIGKVRTKNQRVARRNLFIYENRHLKKTTLVKMINEKFGDALDYTYVNKIIKDEIKKRK